MLETFEFTVNVADISLIHRWIYGTLRTITSPVFNEFVIWILDSGSPWTQMDRDGWAAVDTLLKSIAERNPNFRVVFKGDFHSFRDSTLGDPDGARSFIASYLPLVSSSRCMKFECAPRAENRYGKLGIL